MGLASMGVASIGLWPAHRHSAPISDGLAPHAESAQLFGPGVHTAVLGCACWGVHRVSVHAGVCKQCPPSCTKFGGVHAGVCKQCPPSCTKFGAGESPYTFLPPDVGHDRFHRLPLELCVKCDG